MKQCLVVAVVLTYLRVSQHEVVISCKEYFCSSSLRQPNLLPICEKLFREFISCYCVSRFPKTGYTCHEYQRYGKTKFSFTINAGFRDHRFISQHLSVSKQETNEHEFYALVNTFLNYLPLTNVTYFHLSVPCSYQSVIPCVGQGLDVIQRNQHLALFLHPRRNMVRHLILTNSCIGEFKGSFSATFPGLLELKLNQNSIVSSMITKLDTELFQNLNQLEKLDLSCNLLTTLHQKDMFHGLSSLAFLDLSRNLHLRSIGNIFDPLVKLEVLNVSQTALTVLSHDVLQNNAALRVLELAYCRLNSYSFKDGFFKALTKLEILSLEWNELTTLPSELFQLNITLQYLNVKNNWFEDLNFLNESLIKVVNLDMTDNCLTFEDSDIIPTENSTFLHKNIENFICKRCCLTNPRSEKVLQHSVSTADLRNNPINRIDIDFLRSIAHLKTVYISRFTICVHSFSIETGVYPILLCNDQVNITNDEKKYQTLKVRFNLTHPLYTDTNFKLTNTKIIISDFHFVKCDFVTLMMVNMKLINSPQFGMVRSNMSFRITDFMIDNNSYHTVNDALLNPNVLNAVCNFTFYCPEKCKCTTKGFTEEITITCRDKNMTSFPNIKEFSNPVILYLSNNFIRNVQETVTFDWAIIRELYLDNNLLNDVVNVRITSHMRVLDLRNNKLLHFESLWYLLHLHNFPTTLFISGNPWGCDCDTPEIKNVLIRRNVTDFDQVTCTSSFSKRTLFLANATEIEFCPLDQSHALLIKIIFPTLASIIVLIMAGVIVIYRYKDFLKLWMFTHDICVRCVTEDDIDENKLYDAFVSYSSLDEEWVANNLVRGLETEAPFYKLCLHGRDWLLGIPIPSLIFSSVKRSRRTIIVLTQNFLDSEWSQMEFMAAYKQAIDDQVNRILIVVPGEVPGLENLSHELRTFVTLNTYVKWDDPHFWRKLRSGMPRVIQLNDRQHQQETVNL